MEEIANNIFIESGFRGVVLGVLKLKHGVLLVDAPFRVEDQISWRAKLLNLGGGVDKLLLMLDTHIDRTLGIHALAYAVLGHKNAVEILRNRTVTSRAQDVDLGGEWVPYELPLNIHWDIPDMTYTNEVYIYWDQQPIIVSHQPGAHWAASWVSCEAEKVVFIGDSVVLGQPPFLAWSDIDLWLEELACLQSKSLNGYKIISGRNGLVRGESIEKMIIYLSKTQEILDDLSYDKDLVDKITPVVPTLLEEIEFNKDLEELYENRLIWGLAQYVKHHHSNEAIDSKGEKE